MTPYDTPPQPICDHPSSVPWWAVLSCDPDLIIHQFAVFLFLDFFMWVIANNSTSFFSSFRFVPAVGCKADFGRYFVWRPVCSEIMATPTGPAPPTPPTCFGCPATATDGFLCTEWRNPGDTAGSASCVTSGWSLDGGRYNAWGRRFFYCERGCFEHVWGAAGCGHALPIRKTGNKRVALPRERKFISGTPGSLVYVSLQRFIMCCRIYFLC